MFVIQIIKLMRIPQWYKNLIIFLPLIFIQELFNGKLFLMTLAGFIALSLISSASYSLNDIFDLKKDKKHPEKKMRPLASGKLKKWHAIMIAGILIIVSIWIATLLSGSFAWLVLALFLLTLTYSLFLKHEPFLDIIVIAINFVIRAIAGAVIIDVVISPWLVLCPFFLALFLAVGKREADMQILGKKVHKILLNYTPRIVNMLMVITTTLLMICYALFSFLSDYSNLLYTLPIALYLILRYLLLVELRPEIARNPHKMIKDWRMMVGLIVWLLVTILIIYVF